MMPKRVKLNNMPSWIIASFVLLSGALVFWNIDSQCLWTDEFWTLRRSARSIHGIMWFPGDVHPPFYFIVLHLWRLAFGDSAFSVRAFSAIMGLVTIPVLYLCGKEFGKNVGLFSAGLLAFSPLHIHFCREARMYSLSIFLTVTASFLFLRLLEQLESKGKIHYLVAASYFTTSVLSLYTHYYSAFILFAHFLYLLFLPRKGRLTVLSIQVLSASSILALTPVLLQQLSTGRHGPLFQLTFTEIIIDLGYAFYSFIGGYSTIIIDALFRQNPLQCLLRLNNVLLLTCVAFLYFFIIISLIKSFAKPYLLPLLLLLLPILAPLGLLPIVSIFGYRYLVFSLPWFFLITTLSLSKRRIAQRVIYPGFAIIFILGNYNIFKNPKYGFPEWKEAANYLEANYHPEDIIVHNRSTELLQYYLKDKSFEVFAGLPTTKKDIENEKILEKVANLRRGYKRMWFVETPDPRIGSYYRSELSKVFNFQLKKKFIRSTGITIYLVELQNSKITELYTSGNFL